MDAKKCNIVIVGSGSGGHFYPSFKVANKLSEYHNIFYIVANNKIDHKIIEKSKYKYLNVGVTTLKKNIIKFTISMIKNIFIIKKFLITNKIDLVIGFGGALSFETVIASKFIKIKSIIHEQNRILGRANKILSKNTTLFSSYKLDELKDNQYKIVGNPLTSKAEIKVNDRYDIIVVFGSLGSTSLNKIMINYLLKYHPSYKILFVCKEKISFNLSNLKVVEHLDNLDAYFANAKLVITRAGASTLAQLAKAYCKVIVIPSPYVVKNHQYYNALEFKKIYNCLILNELKTDPDILNNVINTSLNTSYIERTKIEYNDFLSLFIKEVNNELSKD